MTSTGMHLKVKNFFSFIADTYLGYFSSSTTDDEISTKIRTFADEKADYKNFYFGYLAMACNNEFSRPKIEKIRDLYKNQDDMSNVITNVRSMTSKARAALDRLDAVSDQELIDFITKVSRYINLFTLMYFKQGNKE